METHDSLNNQFKLYNYLSKLNINLVEYLENNNIDINYYCFFSKVADKKHSILTSQTTKRENNGYRLITIQDTEEDNSTLEYGGSLHIIFDNVHIKVTEIIDNITNVTKELGIKISTFDSSYTYDQSDAQLFDFQLLYDKNILEDNITKIINVYDTSILNNFENISKLTFGCFYNCSISKNVLPINLKELTFGAYFNQIINKKILPNSLQTLSFGSYYDQIIGVNVLPNYLQTLNLDYYYSHKINEDALPATLRAIFFITYFKKPEANYINIIPQSFYHVVRYKIIY